MTKPFSLEELVARLRGLLRRTAFLTPPRTRHCRSPTWYSKPPAEVTRAGVAVSLTSTEFDLLRVLMRNQRKALTRKEILRQVWDYDFGGKTSIVDLYVSYLRKKIDTGHEPMIHTVRGVGYMLRPPETPGQ